MDSNDYIKTLTVNGKEIKLGMDDYGQCYFIEWEEPDGKIMDTSLGTYNLHYMESVYHMFDPVYKQLSRKDLFGEEFTEAEQKLWDEYMRMFEEEYKKV